MQPAGSDSVDADSGRTPRVFGDGRPREELPQSIQAMLPEMAGRSGGPRIPADDASFFPYALGQWADRSVPEISAKFSWSIREYAFNRVIDGTVPVAGDLVLQPMDECV